ncbi:sec-independent protein translocase protein TatB [Humitalea rosea]|uniref:Sec-independent protein translocase protein TatB n=1 Tax=Humitalea rosea TaxID=990373 RepID=A0A2W7IPK3_9PROT|nr:Sec-independent protein translocase protein TatB [Humitalea rosea]PZW49167.1 sec-independent protein translocase protein TatB [Humitalea rosea]
MFDLAWSEIALIAVVALVVIGPKDLPEAVKGVARGIQKLRRMAGEFQSQVDEVAKDAGVQDLRQSIADIRRFDLKGQIEKAVDKDGGIRDTFSQNPLNPTSTSTSTPASTDTLAPDTLAPDTLKPDTLAPPAWEPPAPVEAPAFVPPGVAIATQPYVPRPSMHDPDQGRSGTPAPNPAADATPAPPAVPTFVPPDVSAAAKPSV